MKKNRKDNGNRNPTQYLISNFLEAEASGQAEQEPAGATPNVTSSSPTNLAGGLHANSTPNFGENVDIHGIAQLVISYLASIPVCGSSYNA